MNKLHVVLLLAVSTFMTLGPSVGSRVRDVISIRFLVSVNDTWDPNGCIATVATPPLRPGVKHSSTEAVHVGKCDQGPLDFQVNRSNDGKSDMTVNLIFHSSVIVDASPPTCSIPWNGTYLVPDPKAMEKSLLPGCYTAESREGYHMTYYWFYLLDWTFG